MNMATKHGAEFILPTIRTAKKVIQNDYTFNALGSRPRRRLRLLLRKTHPITGAMWKKKTTYDSFGNELSYTDENGQTSKTSYDEETGEETETIRAVVTAYESKDKEYTSADGLKP